MVQSSQPDVTELLVEWSKGSEEALQKLIPLVYRELRRLAGEYLRRERRGHTLQPTGGGVEKLSFDESIGPFPKAPFDLVSLDDALLALASVDPRQSRIVELRYFVGLSNEDIARLLDISPATVLRDWRTAKAWLGRELSKTRR